MGGVASTIAALGNGVGDGDLGVIRVTQGGETMEVFLVWDATNSKWVSEPLAPAIDTHDQDWSSNQQIDLGLSWQYFGQKDTPSSLWNLRAGGIPFAGALFAAGLKLQDRASARMYGGGAGDIIYVSPWFYEFDAGDLLSLDNDSSSATGKTWNGLSANAYGFQPSTGNIGHGGVLKLDATAVGNPTFVTALQYEDNITSSGYHGLSRGTGWDYVKFFTATSPVGSALGGVPTTTPYTPAKKYLYPTLYGYGSTDPGHGVAALYWEFRWAS